MSPRSSITQITIHNGIFLYSLMVITYSNSRRLHSQIIDTATLLFNNYQS